MQAQIAQSVEQGTENPRVGGSIPPLGTTYTSFLDEICGSGSVVEHRLAKARAAGSNPVFRSINLIHRVKKCELLIVNFKLKDKKLETLLLNNLQFKI
jgi:hypothetical protein